MNAAEVLDSQLEAITLAVKRAQAFEHLHGLSTRDSRKLAANLRRTLNRWQRVTGGSVRAGDSVNPVSGTARSERAANADKPVTTPSARELPVVPVAPSTECRAA